MRVREIPLEQIFIKQNMRTDTDDELGEQMASMQKYGQLQNCGVYPRDGLYELVWGHRRYRAAQMNNEPMLGCLILDPDIVSESDIPVLKLQENLVRKQLTNDEILAAVKMIERAHPGIGDRAIEQMLGKRHGWLGWRRSLAKAYGDLAARGITREQLAAMSPDDVIDLRARMNNPEKPHRGNKGAFHRDGVPAKGIRIIAPRGPNVIIVCSGQNVKAQVIRAMKKLSSEIG
jgi:hypothetical protein